VWKVESRAEGKIHVRTLGRLTAALSAVYFLLSTFFCYAWRMAFAFEKLLVYQKSITFADAICTITRDLPRGYFFLGNQLSRAATSIAANIAEGNGRFTKADRRNFFGIARGSVQECVPLLELAARQSLIKSDRHRELKLDLEEISRMLSGLINGLERRQS
jgi:four helix bundle protein